RPFGQPVTSEWSYRLVRTLEEEWVAVLLVGGTAYWAVVLGGPAHPAPAGHCGVRGDLESGGAVHLLIDGDVWIPISPVIRVDAEVREQIREDLVHRLTGGVPEVPDANGRP
ncbi:MAG TPA: hypothetical protein VFJ94_00815, partial [Intrasporangium sp.]|uniref:hypothetical protein n=1 Tax=Intrasporangium sp. TaxID=1925024 RepID=UPI002D76E806